MEENDNSTIHLGAPLSNHNLERNRRNNVGSILFTTHALDHVAVNIISKNSQDFSLLATQLGFNLVLQYEREAGLTVRFTPLKQVYDSRKLFVEMEKLIERNTVRSIGLEQRLRDFIVQQVESKTQEVVERHTQRDCQSSRVFEPQDPFHKFFTSKNLSVIKNSDQILNKFCERLSEMRKGDRRDPPLKTFQSIDDRKKALLRYIDVLQDNTSELLLESGISHTIATWFRPNWPQIVHKPIEAEKEGIVREMREKFGLENTVGTIHVLSFDWINRGQEYFYFAVCRGRIVCYSTGTNQSNALKNMICNLKSLKWSFTHKFALNTDEKIDLPDDCFVICSNEDVFKDNEKVVKWICDNFKCLQYTMLGDCLDSIPAFYNMALKYFELYMHS